MAMLMTNEVFARTWGARAGDPPSDDYWPTIISAVHAVAPSLLFIAEAYWDMEWTLQQQGFGLCYDKRLYDRLVSGPASSVRGHLQAAPDYQERLLRFIENHDEPRAADTFTPDQERAAAVVVSTLEGARLYHAGQLEGLHTHIPVFLARGPEQPVDRELLAFHETLLAAVAGSGLHDGAWQLCECDGWPDNQTAEQLVSWCWRTGDLRHLVVVNLADAEAQARVRLPWDDLAGRSWSLRNLLEDSTFERDGRRAARRGAVRRHATLGALFLPHHHVRDDGPPGRRSTHDRAIRSLSIRTAGRTARGTVEVPRARLQGTPVVNARGARQWHKINLGR